MNRALDAIIGGWQMGGIFCLHTGFPLTNTATDASEAGSRGARAYRIASGTVFGEQAAPHGSQI